MKHFESKGFVATTTALPIAFTSATTRNFPVKIRRMVFKIMFAMRTIMNGSHTTKFQQACRTIEGFDSRHHKIIKIIGFSSTVVSDHEFLHRGHRIRVR